MTTDQIVYTVFGVVVVTALILDLGFLVKKMHLFLLNKRFSKPLFG
jgi:hypothetical protein